MFCIAAKRIFEGAIDGVEAYPQLGRISASSMLYLLKDDDLQHVHDDCS